MFSILLYNTYNVMLLHFLNANSIAFCTQSNSVLEIDEMESESEKRKKNTNKKLTINVYCKNGY